MVTDEAAGDLNPTITDVAREAGVSPITVSRALRGSDLVTRDTRARVQLAAAKLGYMPNQVASSLKSQRTGLVAVIVPTISGSVFAETIASITETLKEGGYQILIGESSYAMAQEEQVLRSLVQRRPDAIVIAGVNHTDETRAILRSARVPIVEIWDLYPDPIDMLVGFSNEGAARAMTAALIERGYRRFALATGPAEGGNRAEKRTSGHLQALAEARLKPGPSIVLPHFLGILESGATLLDFVRQHPEVDCLFCTSELIAIGAVVQMRRAGIRVPQDCAVVGFGEVEASVIIDPPLSTVQIRGTEMGREAARLVLKRLAGDAQEHSVIDVGYDLIFRAST